ncbi:MAG TPA: ABC transporter [Opitutae bacterium]|nr:ABC transporter [Opitutae bacterium]|tara:strand:- start:3607 stop:4416 length:810 start_codon:yes stop_codon:yes gene_type:complete
MSAKLKHSSSSRIFALFTRYFFLLRSSWPRIIEIAYWPTMQMVVWGFVSKHFAPSSPELTAGGVLISVVLIWDTLFRSHISYTLSFLEEMWSRNLGNLFVSPLRPWELMLGLACISLIRTLIGMIPAALLAIPFFGVSVFDMGLPLFAFFFNLVLTGWAMSQFVTAILIRYGLGAESLTWVLPFLIAPFSCIYYPLSTLPGWMQEIAAFIPTTYVFEGMRALLIEGVWRQDLLLKSLSFNVIYLGLGMSAFLFAFRVARKHGLLLQAGE